MFNTRKFVGLLSAISLAVASIGAAFAYQPAAATLSEECVRVIKAAISDKEITEIEIDDIKAACAPSIPDSCINAIKAAIADKKITKREVRKIIAACTH